MNASDVLPEPRPMRQPSGTSSSALRATAVTSGFTVTSRLAVGLGPTFSAPVILLRHCQKAPAQRLVLDVVLAQGQSRRRLGHLVAKVKGMAGVNILTLLHLLEQRKRITPLQKHAVV